MKTPVIISLCRCFLFLFVMAMLTGTEAGFAQNTVPVIVKSEWDNNGNLNIYVENTTDIPYTVMVETFNLVNAHVSGTNPMVRTIKPGRYRIMTLSKIDTGRSLNYKIKYNYMTGCSTEKPQFDFSYLLPVSGGKKASAYYSPLVGKSLEESKELGFFSTIFISEEGDTVFAARKGKVVDIVDNINPVSPYLTFSRTRNQLIVVHDDCTFARYATIKDGGFLVQEGDMVYPGQPLGLVAGKEYALGQRIGFQIYYLKHAFRDVPQGEKHYEWGYVAPKWVAKEGNFQGMYDRVNLTAIHPEEIITAEMSKKEKKEWEKTRKKN